METRTATGTERKPSPVINGDNVRGIVQDGKLILTIDLTGERWESASGKSLMVATTRGFVYFSGDDGKAIGVSLNVNEVENKRTK